MRTLLIGFLAAMTAIACSGKKENEGTAASTNTAEPTAATPEAKGPHSGRALLVTQSSFKPDDKGQYTVPDKAEMFVITRSGEAWVTEKVEDAESNVFHKAIAYGDKGILTLGANEAMLKLWTRKDGKWTAETIWHPTFGGKHNRLRDFEVADFNGDGTDDLAIATHDQGVVAVVWNKNGAWVPEELDRKENTFVHEIEVGDLDGDSKLEFFATPSEPNTASGHNQGGKIVRYAWTGESFERSEVVSLDSRHIKEVLVADIEKDGKQELYAAVEAEMGAQMNIIQPVEIRRYDFVDGKFVESLVTTIDDRFCRFLVAGDLDHDGQNELVASAFSAGIWLIEKGAGGFVKKLIDKNSGGFEHATYATDLEGDGKVELYVADDNGGVLRRYDYDGSVFAPTIVKRRIVPSQAMVWNITAADL